MIIVPAKLVAQIVRAVSSKAFCTHLVRSECTKLDCSTSVDLMLGHRRRRWANIKTTLDQRLGSSDGPALLTLAHSLTAGHWQVKGDLLTVAAHYV